MKKTKILIIISSPRKNGNSDKMAKSFADGAMSVGHEVTSLFIRDMHINGCIGCEYCYKHEGMCVQQDDMQTIYSILEHTDIVVFATPIYYQAFPAQLKAVIDRLYVTENRSFPVRGSYLLATYATPGTEMAKFTIEYYHTLVNYHGWEDMGVLVKDGLDEKNDIQSNTLSEAYRMGMNIGSV